MINLKENRAPFELLFSQVPLGDKTARRRILLVEGHPIVCKGLTELINYEGDVEVCGTAACAADALDQLKELLPDLVILDLCLDGREDLELLREIRSFIPDQRVLMLSMHDESLYAPGAIREGAAGYIMKEETTDTLLQAIRHVLDGGIYLSERLSKGMVRNCLRTGVSPVLDPLENLTRRELEVFQLIGHGHSTREIARQLSVSIKTVESHRAQIKMKLNARSVTTLIRMAYCFRQEDFSSKRQMKVVSA